MTKIPVSRGLSNTLVVLLFVHLWLANSSIDVGQIFIELVLVCLLLWLLRNVRLEPLDLVLVVVYALSMALSLSYNSVEVTLLNAKIFGLAILSLLVFSKRSFDARVLMWMMWCHVAFTVYEGVFGGPSWFVSMVSTFGGSWRELVGSRPLGLFMSTHTSATLLAIFFMWLGRDHKSLLAIGSAVLLLNRSIYVLVAYIAHILGLALAWLKVDKIVAAVFLCVLALAFVNAQALLNFDVTTISPYLTSREQASYIFILEQLLSVDAYSWAFTWLPLDSKELASNFINEAGNEVMYFTVLQQGGFILSALYLAMLFHRINGFRIFMAFAMLHYGMPTTPVAIFLMIQWAIPAKTVDEKSSDRAPALAGAEQK